MDFLKDKILENLTPTDQTPKKNSSSPKRSGKSFACVLYSPENQMIHTIREKGFDVRISIQPSIIVRIGLVLLVQKKPEVISQIFLANNEKLEKISKVNKALQQESKSKKRLFTFSFDTQSLNFLKSIVDKGLDIRESWSYSQIIRAAIHQAHTLDTESLKAHFLQLEEKKHEQT